MNPALPRRLLSAAGVAVAVYYAVWGGEYSAFDLRRLGEEREQVASRVVETRAAVDSLRAHAALLENDPATIERVARERFGMIRPGEVLYRFVEVAPSAAAGNQVARAP